MKIIFLKVFIAIIAVVTAHKAFCISAISRQQSSTGFAADSGYILQNNLHSLIKISVDDTLHIIDSETNEPDTLGKYYKMITGNYISCVRISGIYGYPAHIIYETLPDGTVLKKEQFYSVMNLCCWDNVYNGFEKHGDYVSYRACSNGTAFCSTDIYLFKELTSMDEQETISRTLWTATGKEGYYIDITSKMEIKNDTVNVFYTKKLTKEKKTEYRIKKTSFYNAIFTKSNSKWAPADSTSLRRFMINY